MATRKIPIVDDFLQSWISWREACESVHSAYDWWRTCDPSLRRTAFEAYRAALDREEHAARIHWHRSLFAAHAE
jgi:hypothetical protein